MRVLVVLAAVALAVVQAREEPEDAAAGCSRGFTRELRYVCGSDGTIYNNPSIFRYHQCVAQAHGRELTLQHMSHCDPAFDDTQDL